MLQKFLKFVLLLHALPMPWRIAPVAEMLQLVTGNAAAVYPAAGNDHQTQDLKNY